MSTPTRLAEGHLVMLFTLAGWAMAIALPRWASPVMHLPAAEHVVSGSMAWPLTLWMAWEARRMWQRRRAIATGFHAGMLALSPAMLLIAIANGALLLVDRPWSFTSTALCGGGGFPGQDCGQTGLLWVIAGTAFLAMVSSALTLRFPSSPAAQAGRWAASVGRSGDGRRGQPDSRRK